MKIRSLFQAYINFRRFGHTFKLEMTRHVKLGDDQDDMSKAVTMAAESLCGGHVIALPTDTIYGVAGLVQKSSAVNQIYNIKKRDFRKPVAICVADIEDIYRWSKVTVSEDLLKALLPGAVTVVFERNNDLNPDLNPNTSLVGIRIPDYNFIRNLVRKCGGPLALTSANISATQSSLCVEEFQNLWPLLDIVVDGGVLGDTEKSRLGSTVVDLSVSGKYKIIRWGSAYHKTVETLKEHKLEEVEDTD